MSIVIDVDVRSATPADAAGIVRVQTVSVRAYGTDHYDDEQLRHLAPADASSEDVRDNLLGEDRYAVVAEDDGTVVGFGGVRLTDGALLGVFVDPKYGGEGIGTAILERIEVRAREIGLETLSVFGTLNAAGFYEARGFEPIGRRDANSAEGLVGNYDAGERWLPVVELQKSIS